MRTHTHQNYAHTFDLNDFEFDEFLQKVSPQTIFDDRVPADALDIAIFKADHTAWSKKLDKVVMMREAPDHEKDDFIVLSGTKVRDMLGQGIAPPVEFSRPEVAQILMDYYQSIDS